MKKIISTTKAPSAIGPYNQATSFEKLVFTSGQIALDQLRAIDRSRIVQKLGAIEKKTQNHLLSILAILFQK